MKALVYHGPGKRAWEEKPRLVITDAAAQRVMALTEGAGVDVPIEAVGIPATFGICRAIVAAGGRIAVTHRFALNDVMKAYDTFGNAAREGASNVILKNDAPR